jgi:hypothetical protein
MANLNDILRPKSQEEIDDLEKRGFRRDSGKWIFQINISNLINEYNENNDINNFKVNLVNLLSSRISDINLFAGKEGLEKFENIIEKLKKAPDDVEKIDKCLDELYDWADENNVWIESS